ncbi:MAG: nucleoside hydrolase [Acidobacteria bacterium]|nr:nucleoside hydrolase [Acidobacteriota bacterium]
MRLLAVLLMATTGLSAGERIIVDTDCGYYGDDGMTLTMLLRSPAVAKVEGITVVSGNVWARQSARYVGEIQKLLRTRVPVYFGEEMPLRHTMAQADEEHAKWGPLEFRGAFSEKKPAKIPRVEKEPAVAYLTRMIEANPGGITIVALGPLTNIARVLEKQPALAGKIRRLVFMGGQYRVPGNASKEAEFNFWFDPEAASMVLRAPIPEKLMFGLDVCNKVMLDKQGFDAITMRRTALTKRFRQDFGVRYPGFLKNPKATVSLWDALVAAWFVDPSQFRNAERLALDVETRFGPQYGKVVLSENAGGIPVTMYNEADAASIHQVVRRLLTQ